MRALAACLFVVLAATLAGGVESGQACSCALPDPRVALAQADGAFVGKLVNRREGDQTTVLTFSVEKALKGAIGRTVEVSTASDSAACGIEVRTGTRVGLVLDRQGGTWSGYLCWQFDPDELLDAALPLPRPNGHGPVALVVGGGFGESRIAALDSRGRTLAYGQGTGRVALLAICPGGRRLAEIAFVGSEQKLVIRATRTLDIVRRQTLSLPREKYAQRLACEDPAGASVLVFSTSGLYRVKDGRIRPLWVGAAYDAEITSQHAYVSAGANRRALLRVDTRSGRARHVATLPGRIGAMVRNDAGTALAGVRSRIGHRSEIVRVDLDARSTRVTTVRLPRADESGQLFWLRTGRLLFVSVYGSETSRVLDASLRMRSRFRWRVASAAVTGSHAYGIDVTRSLQRVELSSGSTQVVRQLPGRPSVILSVAG